MATAQFPEPDYQHLRQTVAALEERVASLENRLDADQRQPVATADINGLEDDIVRITKELFPGDVTFRITNDPEYLRDSHTLVAAEAAGDIKEIEDRRIQWHHRVTQLSENCRLLRLSLDYKS